jgi:LDH2 family malate/lactate/ureidoglycolate dehydrogenase
MNEQEQAKQGLMNVLAEIDKAVEAANKDGLGFLMVSKEGKVQQVSYTKAHYASKGLVTVDLL